MTHISIFSFTLSYLCQFFAEACFICYETLSVIFFIPVYLAFSQLCLSYFLMKKLLFIIIIHRQQINGGSRKRWYNSMMPNSLTYLLISNCYCFRCQLNVYISSLNEKITFVQIMYNVIVIVSVSLPLKKWSKEY